MKQIETIKSGKNYKAVSVGKMSEIIEHVLPMGPNVTIQGKVFAGQAVGATGSEFSFQTLVPGQDSGFLHTHKTHEELYFILKWMVRFSLSARAPLSASLLMASVR